MSEEFEREMRMLLHGLRGEVAGTRGEVGEMHTKIDGIHRTLENHDQQFKLINDRLNLILLRLDVHSVNWGEAVNMLGGERGLVKRVEALERRAG